MGTARHRPLPRHQRFHSCPCPKQSHPCREPARPAGSPPQQHSLTPKSPGTQAERQATGLGSPAFSPQEEPARSLKFSFPDSFQEQNGEEKSSNLMMNRHKRLRALSLLLCPLRHTHHSKCRHTDRPKDPNAAPRENIRFSPKGREHNLSWRQHLLNSQAHFSRNQPGPKPGPQSGIPWSGQCDPLGTSNGDIHCRDLRDRC